jgi:DNA-binding NarL/FixJ family response regulator
MQIYPLPSGDKHIRILIADDHAVVRHGMKTILSVHSGWTVCGEAKSGAEALALANQLRPDVVIMDLNMPGMNGIEALRAIKSRWPKVEIVVLTVHSSEQLVREIIKAGARGYVMKSDADRDLVDAVSAVAAGKTYFTVQTRTIATAEDPSRSTSVGATLSEPPPTSLTDREREAVRSIAQTMRKLL